MAKIGAGIDAKSCPRCGRGANRDCRRTCPSRRCEACGGLRRVPDLESASGREAIYSSKPCPACTRQRRVSALLRRLVRHG